MLIYPVCLWYRVTEYSWTEYSILLKYLLRHLSSEDDQERCNGGLQSFKTLPVYMSKYFKPKETDTLLSWNGWFHNANSRTNPVARG